MLNFLYVLCLSNGFLCFLGAVGFIALSLSLMSDEASDNLKAFAFAGKVNRANLKRVGNLSRKQAIAKRNFLNVKAKKNNKWLAIECINGNLLQSFRVIRVNDLQSFKATHLLDESDVITIL